ncbi:hypothetical protein D3C76_1404710 [compost metagenome]
MHGHQQLRGRALLPGFHGQGVGDGVADAIGIADVQAQAGALDGGTGDVEGEQRGGEVDAFLEYLGQVGALYALAAHHTIHVCNKKVDELDLGVFLQELGRFGDRNGTRGYRHDATPLLLKISITRGLGCESIRKAFHCQ